MTSPRGRLALLCQHFYPEMISTGIHMTELATGLTRLGWQIEVYCARPSWGAEGGEGRTGRVLDHEGVRIFRVPTLGSQTRSLPSRALFAVTYLLSTAWQLLRRARRYDALIATTNPPFVGLVGDLVRRLTGKPYLFIVYDVYPAIAVNLGVLKAGSPAVWIWERATRMILRGSARVVVIGRDMADIIRRMLAPKEHEKIVLITNWTNETSVTPVPAEQNSFIREHGLEGKTVVQYSGRMGRTHNLEPLIEAAARLGREPIVFQFVGEGAKKPILERMAAGHGLRNVQFLPHQTMERLGPMLSASTLAVVCLEARFMGLSVPSKTYGIMASGKPILGLLPAESEIGRTLAECECGLVLEDPTGDRVASALLDLLSDPNRLRRMGANARRGFLEKFTLATALEKYDAVLREILAR